MHRSSYCYMKTVSKFKALNTTHMAEDEKLCKRDNEITVLRASVDRRFHNINNWRQAAATIIRRVRVEDGCQMHDRTANAVSNPRRVQSSDAAIPPNNSASPRRQGDVMGTAYRRTFSTSYSLPFVDSQRRRLDGAFRASCSTSYERRDPTSRVTS